MKMDKKMESINKKWKNGAIFADAILIFTKQF